MKTILMSIHPKWCEKIFNGEKTIEVRKTAPKPPFKVVVYCTKDNKNKLYNNSGILTIDSTFCSISDSWIYPANGKVIGEFICDRVYKYSTLSSAKNDCTISDDEMESKSCLSHKELSHYELFSTSYPYGVFGLNITAPVLYDKPKELGEFRHKQPKDCCGASYGNYCDGERTDVYCKYVKDYRYTNKVNHAPQNYMRIEEVTL